MNPMETMRRRRYRYEHRRIVEGYGFISIWLIGFTAFMLYPLLVSFKMSFSRPTLGNMLGGPFVGLHNYRDVVLDPQFGVYFVGTLGNALIDIPIIVIFSLFAAVLLNKQAIGIGLFRGIFFIPIIFSGVVMNRLFHQEVGHLPIFDSFVGGAMIVNQIIGTEVFNRLGLLVWRSSVEIMIFLAAMHNIPRSHYEAASVDGATSWETFYKITLPYIAPVVLLNIIYATIDSFTDPLSPIMEYMKRNLLNQMNFGFASALSWLYFGVALLFMGFAAILGRGVIGYGRIDR